MFQIYFMCFYLLSNIMILDFNIFGASMKHEILSYLYATLVVYSQYSSDFPSNTLSSMNNLLNQIASFVPSVIDLYSAFIELSAIVGCLELFHVTEVFPTRNM